VITNPPGRAIITTPDAVATSAAHAAVSDTGAKGHQGSGSSGWRSFSDFWKHRATVSYARSMPDRANRPPTKANGPERS
jgi:hypothetical protein